MNAARNESARRHAPNRLFTIRWMRNGAAMPVCIVV